MVCVLECHLLLPGCMSLKEKRSLIKPLIHRLQRDFRISVAEIALQDNLGQAVIGCALIGTDKVYLERQMQMIVDFIEKYWKDIQLLDFKTEFL